jgi:hypothetical protein
MAVPDDFKAALLDAYRRTGREAGYWSRYFLRSLKNHGAVETAKRFLAPRSGNSSSQGFRALAGANRLDLSVEAIALQPRFRTLFTATELAEARRRLQWPEPQTIAAIAEALNSRAAGRPIGGLQELRRQLRGLTRTATQQLFDSRTIFETYAFHVGGRTEIQFNIGAELVDEQEFLRHGVAFSLELSQNLPAIDPLVPKIARFNEFLRLYPDELSDLRMWHHAEGGRSTVYAPAPIPTENVRPGVFIFLGQMRPAAHVDLDLILNDFDRLLPLYRFVESNDPYPVVAERGGGFRFSPGCRIKPSITRGARPARELDILLRHNELQVALHTHLADKLGAEFVGTEQGTGTGSRVDLVVRTGDRYRFYEIKTALSARACIREALAQLLDYAFWPGAQEAERLVIVGEPPLDAEAKAFLELMRERFSLPVYYQQFNMAAEILIE